MLASGKPSPRKLYREEKQQGMISVVSTCEQLSFTDHMQLKKKNKNNNSNTYPLKPSACTRTITLEASKLSR